MAVGVGEDDVVLRDDAVADDLVRAGGAAEDEESPVRAEDAGGVAFGLARRPEVIEPRAERRGGDAEVRAHEVFAEELVELHADGMLEKGHAAHVAGRVPGVSALVGVLLQLAEVRRQKLLVVALDGEVDAVGDEGGRVAEEVDVLVDLLDDFERQFADQRAVGDEEDWNFFIAAADGAQNLQRGALVELVFAFQVPVQQNRRVRWVGADQRQAILGRRGADDLIAFLDRWLRPAVPWRDRIRNPFAPTSLAINRTQRPSLIHLSLLSLDVTGSFCGRLTKCECRGIKNKNPCYFRAGDLDRVQLQSTHPCLAQVPQTSVSCFFRACRAR